MTDSMQKITVQERWSPSNPPPCACGAQAHYYVPRPPRGYCKVHAPAAVKATLARARALDRVYPSKVRELT